jgi:hypothetical protein
VTTIGGLAFAHCAALTSVIFLGLKAPAQVGEKWIIKTGEDILGYANANSDFPAPGKFFHGLKMSGPSTVRSGYLARKNGIIVEELQQKLHQINR